ncbi:MAG: YybH family protein [Candidatus Heimdallarchaeota archaeon]
MKIFSFFLLAIILFSIISCSDEIDTTSERLGVQQILYKYAEAWRVKNMDLFSELFSNDVDMIIFDGNSSKRFVGWIAWEQRLEQHSVYFQNVDISYENEVIKVDKSGNIAWLSCIANTKFTYQGKPGIMSGLRMTWVLEKRKNNWIIVHAHFSFPKE